MPVVKPKPGARKSKSKKEARFDKVLMEPGKYEVTKDSVFTVKVPLKAREDKWWVLCKEKDADTVEKAVFRMWTYDEMVEMRKLATKYDQLRRVHMIDHDVLNRLKVQRLMTAWTFGRDNPRLGIHHVNGVLSDESWQAITKMQPNILKHIMEEMNDRYEFGG